MRCDRCNTENDPQSKFCKNCGTKLYTNEDEVIFEGEIIDDRHDHIICPKCGSNNIHFVTREEGSDYDAGNACCGYLIFGPIGLICGLFSDKKTMTVRKCMRCNHEF